MKIKHSQIIVYKDRIIIKNRELSMIESMLLMLGLKKENIAERANRKLMRGDKVVNSPMRHISGKQYNEMMQKAVDKYNKTHDRKLFVD